MKAKIERLKNKQGLWQKLVNKMAKIGDAAYFSQLEGFKTKVEEELTKANS